MHAMRSVAVIKYSCTQALSLTDPQVIPPATLSKFLYELGSSNPTVEVDPFNGSISSDTGTIQLLFFQGRSLQVATKRSRSTNFQQRQCHRSPTAPLRICFVIFEHPLFHPCESNASTLNGVLRFSFGYTNWPTPLRKPFDERARFLDEYQLFLFE